MLGTKIRNLGSLLLFALCAFWSNNTSCSKLSVALELANVHYIKDKAGKIKPTVFMGDSFTLKAITTGKKRGSNSVTVPGIKRFRRISTKDHSNVSILNSDISVEKSTVYTLQPKTEGAFTIGPARLTHNGKTITSNTVKLYVANPSERHTLEFVAKEKKEKNQAPAQEEAELFCELNANKNSAFIEEPIEITLSIYRRGTISDIRLHPPDFPGCTVKTIKETKEYTKKIRDKQYLVAEKKFIVFPGTPGKLPVSPAQIVYRIPNKQHHRYPGSLHGSFFANFFTAQHKQKVSGSNPLSLTIKPLPPHDKKADGIGSFTSFLATTNKVNVDVNEPISLTLTLNGMTNFDLILHPSLTVPPVFKSYESKSTNHVDKKTFEFIVQVSKPGSWTIPSQQFTYFDTEQYKYKTIATKPIELRATMPTGDQPQPNIPINRQSETSEQENEPLVTDINFIREEEASAGTKQTKIPYLLFILLLLALPIIIFFSHITKACQPVYKRLFGTKDLFTIYNAKLNKIIEANRPEKIYGLFIKLLATSYHVPVSHVRQEWIEEKLKQSGLENEKISAFITFLNECAQYSFASEQKRATNAQNLAQEARSWMTLIKRNR